MFEFKQFKVDDSNSALKVGTDGVLLGLMSGVPGVSPTLVLVAD